MFKNRLWPVLLVFLVVLVLLIVFRSAVRQTILIPLYYSIWLASLLIKYLGQVWIWVLLLAVCAFVMARSLLLGSRAVRLEMPASRPRVEHGRVFFWSRQVHILLQSAYFSEFSAYELRKLLINVLAEKNNLSPNEVVQWVEVDEPAYPAVVHRFLQRGNLRGYLRSSMSSLAAILQRLAVFLKVRRPPDSSPAETDLDLLLTYLENQLEAQLDVDNDGT